MYSAQFEYSEIGKRVFNPFPPSKYFQQEETTKRQVKTKLPISSQLSQTSGSVDMHAKNSKGL